MPHRRLTPHAVDYRMRQRSTFCKNAIDDNRSLKSPASLSVYCLIHAALQGYRIDRDRCVASQPPTRRTSLHRSGRQRVPFARHRACAMVHSSNGAPRTLSLLSAARVGLTKIQRYTAIISAEGLAYAGQDREAIEHGEEAIRLSPGSEHGASRGRHRVLSHYLSGGIPKPRSVRRGKCDCAGLSGRARLLRELSADGAAR